MGLGWGIVYRAIATVLISRCLRKDQTEIQKLSGKEQDQLTSSPSELPVVFRIERAGVAIAEGESEVDEGVRMSQARFEQIKRRAANSSTGELRLIENGVHQNTVEIVKEGKMKQRSEMRAPGRGTALFLP